MSGGFCDDGKAAVNINQLRRSLFDLPTIRPSHRRTTAAACLLWDGPRRRVFHYYIHDDIFEITGPHGDGMQSRWPPRRCCYCDVFDSALWSVGNQRSWI